MWHVNLPTYAIVWKRELLIMSSTLLVPFILKSTTGGLVSLLRRDTSWQKLEHVTVWWSEWSQITGKQEWGVLWSDMSTRPSRNTGSGCRREIRINGHEQQDLPERNRRHNRMGTSSVTLLLILQYDNDNLSAPINMSCSKLIVCLLKNSRV